MNDFSKFTAFVKGTVITAEVIKASNRKMRNEMKMYFNRILNACQEYERALHKALGPQNAENEDEINSAIVGLIWKFFEMKIDERTQFIDHINSFEYNDKDGTKEDTI